MKKLPFKSATHNPLDFIDADDPDALAHCRDLAEALVIPNVKEDGNSRHFSEMAGEFIAGITAAVVADRGA